MSAGRPLDLDALRRKMAEAGGPRYWRGVEDLAGTDPALDADDRPDGVSRRTFLATMAASIALASLHGCARQPVEHIVPYVEPPEGPEAAPSLLVATAWPFRGYGTGVLAKCVMGRPIKIEGNPDHPASLGKTDALAQASIFDLWDPDRSQAIRHGNAAATWADVTGVLDSATRNGGEGLRLLTGTITSPTLAAQIARVLESFPGARWHSWEPGTLDAFRAGALLAFGEPVATSYRLDRASVIVALDADFLSTFPGSVRYAVDFASRRRVRAGASATMSRLYAVESLPSITGAMADHRRCVQARRIEDFARALALQLGIEPSTGDGETLDLDPDERAWIALAASDLRAHRGEALVLAGEGQPAVVHALALAMNARLDALGGPAVCTEPVEVRPPEDPGAAGSLVPLVEDMAQGRVKTLVVCGVNPVYAAPGDLELARAMSGVPLRVHLGAYFDETAQLCHWHVPEAHYLETWGDVRAHDGTAAVQQAVIAPLYNGVSPLELLSALEGRRGASARTLVREQWARLRPGEADDDRAWTSWLRTGVIPASAGAECSVRLRDPASWLPPRAPSPSGLELVIRPDPTVWDGRFANNGWLQELPKPLTKLTWDNAALMGPLTAQRLEVATNDLVRLQCRGRAVTAPVYVQPGHADESVTLHLGYGRTAAGRVGTGAGFPAAVVWSSKAPLFDGGLAVTRLDRTYPLAVTHAHHTMEGRDLVRETTLATYRANPASLRRSGDPPPRALTLYPDRPEKAEHRWGMSIDLNTCIGCNACVVACQAENNGPVVGKDQVLRNREMHWIRIDRYYVGSLEAPRIVHQPVTCMHCENAPCELVCPVGATVHSPEGLNEMVYNRCVGTRYCSNNCPYKVRRFNFLHYTAEEPPAHRMHWNPDVTVRGRGVMEKCTYCVQRIQEARIAAEREGRALKDGDVVTACQQACPADAIVFGDLADAGSRVAKLAAEPLDYGLLTELNTRPRTTYLGKLRNPQRELAAREAAG